MVKHEILALIDCAGSYKDEAVRKFRSLNIFCEVINPKSTITDLQDKNIKGIIILHSKLVEIETNEKDISKDIVSMNVPILNLICDSDNQNPDDLQQYDQRMFNLTINPNNLENENSNDVFGSFLFGKCGFSGDWNMADFAEASIKQIKEIVGDKKVLCALSGGVDSSVAAVLVSKAIGKNLTCIFVDHGLMRHNEGNEIEEVFTNLFDLNFVRVNAKDRFFSKLEGVSEPEKKRKIIGEEFIRVFEEEARKIGAVDFLCQGTIYPDIIESGTKDNALIKSHHNVGGLPEVIDFKDLLEPLKYLYKAEVRAVGSSLGIPAHLVNRQPFPGPGLGVRVLGKITSEKVEVLQMADHIYREEIVKAGWDSKIWQYFAVLPDVKTVGIKNNKRSYAHLIALRAVMSVDAMTADFVHIPYEILDCVAKRICSEIENVNRVVYDVTSKPCASIEWE